MLVNQEFPLPGSASGMASNQASGGAEQTGARTMKGGAKGKPLVASSGSLAGFHPCSKGEKIDEGTTRQETHSGATSPGSPGVSWLMADSFP